MKNEIVERASISGGDQHRPAPMTSTPYESSREHLLARLARLDLLVRAYVGQVKSSPGSGNDFKGLYLSDAEVDDLLQQQIGVPSWWHGATASLPPETRMLFNRLGQDIDARTAESARCGVPLKMVDLSRYCNLSEFDCDLLILALAPEVDIRYERLYAYLQDDITRKKPSVDLILSVLCPSVHVKLSMRDRLSRSAPLLRFNLVSLVEDSTYTHAPLLSKYVKVDERIVNYLLEFDEPDHELLAFTQPVTPQIRLADMLLPVDLKERLIALSRQAVGGTGALILYFQGGYGVGKQSTAEGLCRELGRGLLIIDLRRLIQLEPAAFQAIVQRANREALLRGAALYWRDFDLLLADDKRLWLEAFLTSVEARSGLTFFSGALTWEPADALRNVPFVRVPFELPAYAGRVGLWERTLSQYGFSKNGLELQSLANKFHLTGGQIEDSTVTAQNLARFRDPEKPRPSMTDLVTASRLQSQRKLSALAKKIQAQYRWTDIVLPSDRLEQLREICNQAKHRALVYEEWGFDRKLSLGKGLTVLFSGPSGTGKTMAAEILAQELALDLYKIDLSMVVSKYIGETEKNLASIFNEARSSNTMLFFDEADALFGKRSEVRDAHDRYANIEVGFLLQKMEEYEGIVILATNLRKNMDDAFVRRVQSTVEFPFPSGEDRLRIWEGVWPLETPRSAELNLDFLAKQFEISGGHIRNIALAATFLAAEDHAPVCMKHILAATRREYQKIGRVVMEGEFTLPERNVNGRADAR